VNRLVELFRVSSSMTAVIVLVLFNLLPLAGVTWWGWNVYTLLVLYWLENGIIGALNVPRILLAEGPLVATPGVVSVRGLAGSSRPLLVPFFVMHYGIFWAVHGVFVFLLPVFVGLGSVARSAIDAAPSLVLDPWVPLLRPFLPDAPADVGVQWDVVVWGAIGLAISHGASFVLNFLGRREYLAVSPIAQTFAPYGRVVVLHITILVGAFISALLGSPIGAIAVLVAVKTTVDLALHLREHRRVATRAAHLAR
jgi:hypothetical protein